MSDSANFENSLEKLASSLKDVFRELRASGEASAQAVAAAASAGLSPSAAPAPSASAARTCTCGGTCARCSSRAGNKAALQRIRKHPCRAESNGHHASAA